MSPSGESCIDKPGSGLDKHLSNPPHTRQKARVIALRRFPLPLPLPLLLIVAMALGLTAMLRAQIEGGERGVPPIDSSSSFEVSGIEVDVYGANADAARLGGWREAQRKGWNALWARTHGGANGPGLSDSALDGIVAGIIVEEEQIGPRRYIARLGVLFDRAKAGQFIAAAQGGPVQRSAPLLVVPVLRRASRPAPNGRKRGRASAPATARLIMFARRAPARIR